MILLTDRPGRQGALVGVVADIGLAAIGGVQRRAGGKVVLAEARVVRLADAIQVAGLCASLDCLYNELEDVLTDGMHVFWSSFAQR